MIILTVKLKVSSLTYWNYHWLKVPQPLPGPVLFLKNGPEKLPKGESHPVDFNPEPPGEFKRPAGHFMRYIEPNEDELSARVEYDMDEQGWKFIILQLVFLKY